MTKLIAPDGREYRSSDPVEIKRLTAGYGYVEAAGTFHPDEKSVDEVKKYIKENPVEADRVLSEERQGKNRSTIVGSADKED